MTGLEGLAAILFVCMMPVVLVWISRHYEYKCKLLDHERVREERSNQVLKEHGENMVVAAERLLQASRLMHVELPALQGAVEQHRLPQQGS